MKHIIQSLFTLLLLCGSLQATTVIKLSLDQMIQKASAIVHASVTQIKTEKVGKKIITSIQLQTIEQLKGDVRLGEVWTLEQVGGTILKDPSKGGHPSNQITQRVLGQAVFSEKEEVLLFLEQTSDQKWVVLGMSQGKYRIETQTHRTQNAIYQTKQAQRELSELSFYQSTETIPLQGQITNIDSFELDLFKSYLQEVTVRKFQAPALNQEAKIQPTPLKIDQGIHHKTVKQQTVDKAQNGGSK